MKDWEKPEEVESLNMKDLLSDYASRYKRGMIDDIDAYLKMVHDHGYDQHFFDIGMNRTKFDDMTEFLDDYLGQQ